MSSCHEHRPPVAIGGVGGSGTRLIASIVIKLGYYLGTDLNEANDNLWFTLLFKRAELWPPEQHYEEIGRAYTIFAKAMSDQQPWQQPEIQYIRSLCVDERPKHDVAWLHDRADRLVEAEYLSDCENWGWKEPNTHIFLPALLNQSPNLKYIHVVRHGLDMALGVNQNQLRLWGRQILQEPEIDINPSTSFRYWCAAHRRIAKIGKTMGNHFLMLNYDKLCMEPESGLVQLLNFLRIKVTRRLLNELVNVIETPQSMGRHRLQKPDEVNPEDLAYLTEMGYSILE